MTKMNARIHNRTGETPADHWYQIEVSGEHPAVGNRIQVIDPEALQAILNRFQEEAKNPDFTGLLVDADHLSHDMDHSTEAFAWARELAIRNGELFARLELTDLGQAAVSGQRYKFFSTEYDPEHLQSLGDGRVRPTRLCGLAFTNRPNNKGAQPISNRAGTKPAGETLKQQATTTHIMQPIAEKLGLSPDAKPEEILAAIDALQQQCNDLTNKCNGDAADKIMNRFGARVPEAVRPQWRDQLIANREPTEKLMEASFPVVTASATTVPPIHNRETAKTPDPVSDGKATEGDHKKAAAIRNRAAEIQRAQGIPYNRAFGLAQSELG